MSISDNFSMQQINQALEQISKIEVDEKSSSIKSRIYTSPKQQQIAVRNSPLFRVLAKIIDYISGYRKEWQKGLEPLAHFSSKIKQLVDQQEWSDTENPLSKIDLNKLDKVNEKIKNIQNLVKTKEVDSGNKTNPNDQWISDISENISTMLNTIHEKKAGFEKALKLEREEKLKSEITTLFIETASFPANGLSMTKTNIRETLNEFSAKGLNTIILTYPEEIQEPQDRQLQVPKNFNKDAFRFRSISINDEQMHSFSLPHSTKRVVTEQDIEIQQMNIKQQQMIDDQKKIKVTKKLQEEFGVNGFENLAYLIQQDIPISYAKKVYQQVVQPLENTLDKNLDIQMSCSMDKDGLELRILTNDKDKNNPFVTIEIITPLTISYVLDAEKTKLSKIIIRTEISAPLAEWQEKIEGKNLNEILPHLSVIDHMSMQSIDSN